MSTDVSVLHVIAGLHPNAGGPSQTVVRLADSLAEQPGVRIGLLSQSLREEPEIASLKPGVVRSVPSTRSRISLKLGLPLRRTLVRMTGAAKPDLLHSHGLWLPVNHWVAWFARKMGIPFCIHTRGMLRPWALSHRRWKKRMALRLYQSRDLSSAVLFFVTADQEIADIRQLGLKQPIAVIPNGVDLPADKERDLNDLAEPPRRRVLFIGRIHPVKGLLNLVEAWARVRPKGWVLRLIGPDEDGHLAEVMRRVRYLNLVNDVEYAGIADSERKTALLDEAHLLILPSFSENFGMVVAEALAHGIPVIATRGTPWSGLETHGCGWWVEPNADRLTEALREAVSLEGVVLRQMGAKGRIYAGCFNWHYIARQTADVYRWLLRQGPRPDCIVEN